MKQRDYSKYPVRRCVWLNHCEVCDADIKSGQLYRDGGYGRRAHLECLGLPPEPPKAEVKT